MNAEHPTPPSGPSDPTAPQGPTQPQSPVDFTEHGSSILDDEDDADKAKEPTPEEKAEREIFDKCRSLATVIIAKTSSGQDEASTSTGVIYGSAIPAELNEQYHPDYLDHRQQVQWQDEDTRPDRPHTLHYYYQIPDNSDYSHLEVGIYNFDPIYDISPLGKRIMESESVEFQLATPSSQLPADTLNFDFMQSGKLDISKRTFNQNPDDNPDHDNDVNVTHITDYKERMIKLNQLYEILTNLYAEMPRNSAAPNPSAPPDNLVQ